MSILLSPPASRDPAVTDPASTDPARDAAGEGTRPDWRAVIGPASLTAIASYLATAVALAALTAAAGAGGSVAEVAQRGAVGWLAAHHVPLTIDGAPLGVLPLLPTLLLGALIARGAASAAARSGITQPAEAGWVMGAIAGTHGILGGVLALVATPVMITADPAQAAVGCALVAGAAAGLGLARPCGLLAAALRQAPEWVRPGLEAGLWGLAILLCAGFATVLTALAESAADVIQMSGSDVGSVLGLIVLSIGYLPNAAIAGLSWLAGPGFSVGALAVSPFVVHPGPLPPVPLPPVPLLAALPQGPVQPWWGIVLVVPLLVGVAVGRRCAAAGKDLEQRLRVLAVAATALAFGSAVLGGLAGGRLGAAAFDPVDVAFGAVAAAVLGATLLGGCAAILLTSRAAGTAATPDRTDVAHPEPPSSAVTDGADSSAVELGISGAD